MSTSASSLHDSSTLRDCDIARFEQAAASLLDELIPLPDVISKRQATFEALAADIESELGCKCALVGSFPSRVHLPDSDVDVTLLLPPGCDEADALEGLYKLLHGVSRGRKSRGSRARDAPGKCPLALSFHRVQISARVNGKVRVIKCVIDDIHFDITVNRVNAVMMLCFHETMDEIFQRDHLYKKAVLLIKAWALYESRILGSHDGLLASSAIQVMVVYLLNVYYFELTTPWRVFCKFFEVFADFPWLDKGVSVLGPVDLSALALKGDPVVGRNVLPDPPPAGRELRVPPAYLLRSREHAETITGSDKASRGNRFQVKYINIVDPLRHSNNLGISVNRGNSVRLRAVLRRGLRDLADALRNEDADCETSLWTIFRGARRAVEVERISTPPFSPDKLSIPMDRWGFLLHAHRGAPRISLDEDGAGAQAPADDGDERWPDSPHPLCVDLACVMGDLGDVVSFIMPPV